MGGVMELDLGLARSCMVPVPLFPTPACEDNGPVVDHLLLLLRTLAEPRELFAANDLLALAMTCKALYRFFAVESDMLLRYCGMIIRGGWPNGFSPLKLYHQTVKAQVDNVHWQRSLLSADFAEKRLTDKLMAITVHVEEGSSNEFWLRQLLKSMAVSRFPTGPQASDVLAALNTVRKLDRASLTDAAVLNAVAAAAAPDADLGADAAAAAASSSSVESDPMPKPNEVLGVLVGVTLAADAATAAASGAPLNKKALAALLPSMAAIEYAVALSGGASVDELKTKWSKPKIALPRPLRAAIVMAMGGMSLTRLMDMFKKPGFYKALFRALHFGVLVGKVVPASAQPTLYMLQALLTERKYPASAAEFAETAWAERVAAPLGKLASARMFEVADAELWSSPTWVEALAGRKLHKPLKNTVDNVLAREGNTHHAWDKLFELGLVTHAQVLANLRTLILLEYPSDNVGAVLSAAADKLKAFDLLKVVAFLQETFTEAYVARLEELVAGVLAGGAEADAEGLVRVQMEPISVRDKKGQVKSIVVHRRVSATFSAAALEPYVAMLRAAANTAAEREVAGGPVYDTAVVINSPELHNPVRTGIPPVIPEYSRTSLWRNEGVVLQQLVHDGETLDVMMPGISWCQAKDGPRIDLDLSIMVYSSSWEFLERCSYQKTTIAGCRHSGDKTSAPFPEGAREDVQITLAELLEGFPTAKYVVIVVFSYSGVAFDAMHDASVFVANPHSTGTGPQGMDVISAARLSGETSVNIAGYITLDREAGTQKFTCLDHSPSSNNRTASASTSLVAQMVSEADKANASQAQLRLINMAAFIAGNLARKVVVVSADGEIEVELTGTALERYEAVLDVLRTSPQIIKPVYRVPQPGAYGESIVVLGGELDDPQLVAHGMGAAQVAVDDGDDDDGTTGRDGTAVVFVNMRSDKNAAKLRKYKVPGTKRAELAMVVEGWDTLKILAKAVDTLTDAADAGPSGPICD
ncbi:uncharacterized protein AMSG_10594 [Thecamonas trahens ATCC 50062]|uniref:Uncharacterized protein n=1 Tax=Thecamonas trahens ATCC 50062 TaxID=461836 RepID=A0A0L0DRL0_THETB|nr:hypothetical protein AMSG_10594 [Thecamonas trahens ATCC 50062]KNC54930.1 hypothetical protein AMSG_10594 [Thecamonas trahens ATCC 50062]|eukprot:XP_013753518.1 hypothetical protein AMSG_10594 [Thecamonas trahens ATCC 50062]